MSRENGSDRKTTFTGHRISRQPRRTVILADILAKRLITLSGIGGIVAVSLVGLFLVWVALPLLLPSKMDDPRVLPAGDGRGGEAPVLSQGIGNYGSLAWHLLADGSFVVQELDRGRYIDRVAVREGMVPTAGAMDGGGGIGAFGFADGSLQLARVDFATRYLAPDEEPPDLAGLGVGERGIMGRGLAERTPEGQLRLETLAYEPAEPVAVSDHPLTLVDIAPMPSGTALVALDAAGVLHHRILTRRTNMLTGEVRVTSRGGSLDLAGAGLDPGLDFAHLRVDDTGDLALLTTDDGRTFIFQKRDAGFQPVGEQDLVPAEGSRVTAMAFLVGGASLAVGDSDGGLTVWFPVRGTGTDPTTLAAAHVLEPGPAAVTALGPSLRSRMLAAGYADGTVRAYHVTSRRLLGETAAETGPVSGVTLAPRENLILATGSRQASLIGLEATHGDVSLGLLFRPVWYEGYPGPDYVWQSSGATDSFEPKLSLVPLIFGTLKATFYSLLFGLPLAILAAIYTSEFLDRKVRARVKPVIETMASLPSVVLGFLAALVVAPLVEDVVVEVLAVLVLAPGFVLLASHLWQLLPRSIAARTEHLRPYLILAALALGTWVAWQLGPALETLGFEGDVKAWLDGRVGSGVSGWFLLLITPAGLLVAWLNAVYGEGVIRSRGRGWGPARLAALDLGRFLISCGLAVAVAIFVGWLLDSSGWDPRGSVFGTYVQRNALVVGIAMGFAVIPLIYTISEDALTSVPDHLRAASLGAGATPWQTAILVVVPPAMSGLFSAAMIGLGRAVGETMIVLMAAGNTPIMDMNIFNGFRTLSANLAVELPEAVQNSTHYRVLFLAALALFAMTFILNTVAEAVRLHFRGKTKNL
jgi:phosphate transport system permease protein